MDDDALYAKLPAAVSKVLRDGLATNDPKKIVKALSALSFPVGSTFPRVEELSDPHRAAATLLANHETPGLSFKEKGVPKEFALPTSAAGRRRWLGIDPPGPLDVRVPADGGEAPLWQVLQARAQGAGPGVVPAEPIRGLPPAERLAAIVDLFDSPYKLEQLIKDAYRFCLEARDLDALDASFATALADRVVALRGQVKPGPAPNAWLISSEEQWRLLRWVAFASLLGAKVAIEARWDALVPITSNWQWSPGAEATPEDALLSRCFELIPAERRTGILLDALRRDSQSLFGVLRLCVTITHAPEVVDALLERTLPMANSWMERVVAALATLVPAHPEVGPRIDAALARRQADQQFDPGKLAVGERASPASVDAMSAGQREQLQTAGRLWDGRDLDAATRIAPEDEARGSLGGLLERVEITANGAHAYDVWLIADGGTVFEAGTTAVVDSIAQNHVESSKLKLAKALQAIVRKRGR